MRVLMIAIVIIFLLLKLTIAQLDLIIGVA